MPPTAQALVMNVWAVFFTEDDFTEDKLYQTGLVLVDPESQSRIKRFYHKRDSYRCLLGRLLPRLLLKQHGIAPKEAIFGRTSSGKPYVSTPRLERTLGFNISHDNEYVVMAFQTRTPSVDAHATEKQDVPQTHENNEDVTTIGVDVMKVALPRYEKTLSSFVQSISETLTPLEQRTLLEKAENNEALRRLYLVWTLKEAYTKAVGLGLGFDFKRIEVDLHALRVSIDGSFPVGWEFTAFTLESQSGNEYQVAVARFTGITDGESSHLAGHVDVRGRVEGKVIEEDWFVQYDMRNFVARVASEK